MERDAHRLTRTFADASPGEMSVTVTLRSVPCGTEPSIAQEGIPSVIPVELCCLGGQESLSLLASVVEPTIP